MKSQIYCIPRKIQKGKFIIKWQDQKLKHIKQMNNKCQIPNLGKYFSCKKLWSKHGFIASKALNVTVHKSYKEMT